MPQGFDPKSLSPAERYKLLIGAVIPRPIAFVSTVSPGGVENLAPFSFFNGVGGTPMTLMFCPANNADGTEKDTLRNCKPVAEGGTGEFVVNLATESYAALVAGAAEPLPPDQSEFLLTGLVSERSELVSAPKVKASPMSFECVTDRVIRLAEGEPGGANIVIGRVVFIHAQDGVVDERFRIDPDALRLIGRLAGQTYCTTRDRFEMPPGKAALNITDPG